MTTKNNGSNLNQQNKKVRLDSHSIRKRCQSVSYQGSNEINTDLRHASLAKIPYSTKVAPPKSFKDSFNLKKRLRLNVAGKCFEVCFFLFLNKSQNLNRMLTQFNLLL